ncbi:MAG: Trp operon repressor [Candidatus Paceibacteria bacterium]|jgi:Trp operon repressor
MKRKIDDLSIEDQALTRKLLMLAARKAAANGTIEQFMENLLTPSEQIMFGRRIWIARLLLAGKQFSEIGARLLVGPATVQKIEKQLLGEIPDYGETIKLNRRKATRSERQRRAAENPLGLTALKQKYPFHFLLFPWPK